jgi:putative membrane protein
MTDAANPDNRLIVFLAATLAVITIWSAVRPFEYFTWFLEVLPAIIGVAILAATFRRFRLTPLVYVLIALHIIILLVGGHYTYARVPLFNWIRDYLHLARNDFDRVGHFAQGFVPALVAREVLIRNRVVKRGAWLFVIVVSICLAISALYELFEWGVAVATGTAATDFLGTQGDPWDTQEDMATCLVGSIAALLTLPRLQDRQLERTTPTSVPGAHKPEGSSRSTCQELTAKSQ